MTYLLDANVVVYFLGCGREDDLMIAARRCPLAIADEVRVELLRSPSEGGRFRAWFSNGAIANLPIVVGSDIERTYLDLQPPSSLRGKGERASIALAAHDRSLVLVANDRNAMWLALTELHESGERMIGVPVFLRRLRHEAGIDPAAIDDVIACYNGRRPTWWASWRAGLAAIVAPVE